MIYAQVKFPLTIARSAQFVQAVVFSSANIIGSAAVANTDYPEFTEFKEVARYCTMFAYLSFTTQENLDKFVGCGLNVTALTEADVEHKLWITQREHKYG